MRIGRVDLAPLVAMTILFFLFEAAERGLVWLYAHRIS
jgi:hypothetical protein